MLALVGDSGSEMRFHPLVRTSCAEAANIGRASQLPVQTKITRLNRSMAFRLLVITGDAALGNHASAKK